MGRSKAAFSIQRSANAVCNSKETRWKQGICILISLFILKIC
jgi:hypothetical protein